MSRPFTATIDSEFGVCFLDVSKTQRRLIRVTTKTYQTTGTYIFIKLFKKGSDEEYYIDQRITLTVPEFQELINNVENINMGAKKEDQKESATTKRSDTTPKKVGNSSNSLILIKLNLKMNKKFVT